MIPPPLLAEPRHLSFISRCQRGDNCRWAHCTSTEAHRIQTISPRPPHAAGLKNQRAQKATCPVLRCAAEETARLARLPSRASAWASAPLDPGPLINNMNRPCEFYPLSRCLRGELCPWRHHGPIEVNSKVKAPRLEETASPITRVTESEARAERRASIQVLVDRATAEMITAFSELDPAKKELRAIKFGEGASGGSSSAGSKSQDDVAETLGPRQDDGGCKAQGPL